MKKGIAILLVCILALSLCSCGRKAESAYYYEEDSDYYYSDSYDSYSPAAGEAKSFAMTNDGDFSLEPESPGNSPESFSADRKVIYTANVTVETKMYGDAAEELMKLASSCGAYVDSSNEGGSEERGNRYMHVTFRVPAERYNDFLSQMGNIGSVKQKNQSCKDVTTEYIDTEARIKSLEDQRARLEELRSQAGDLSDLLEIEQQISYVQYELESYQGTKNYLDNQVSYCTVTVALDEVKEYTPQDTSFGSRFREAIGETLSNFGEFLGNFVIDLIYALPFLVFFGFVLWGIIALFRKLRAKRKAKKAAKEKNNE